MLLITKQSLKLLKAKKSTNLVFIERKPDNPNNWHDLLGHQNSENVLNA